MTPEYVKTILGGSSHTCAMKPLIANGLFAPKSFDLLCIADTVVFTATASSSAVRLSFGRGNIDLEEIQPQLN
jgi:hypothetical protein